MSVALRLLFMFLALLLLVLTLCADTIQYTAHNTSPTHTTELEQLRAVLLAADYTVHGVATVLGLGAAAAAGVGIALQNVSVPAVAATIAKALPSEVSTNLYTVLMLVLVYSSMHSVLASLDSALVASTSCTSKTIN
jgi:apolipoprotein N-acyltransferase